MKIAVSGARGAIGKYLTPALAERHQVVGLVRRPVGNDDSGIRYVPTSNRFILSDELKGTDCFIHAALDRKAPRGQFVEHNLDLTRDMLKLAADAGARQFIYFSSQAVYSGATPASEHGYSESQGDLDPDMGDPYTRLKVRSELLVKDFCRESGMRYLILRPTIVLGKGAAWTDGMARLMRVAPYSLRDSMLNLIHAGDLSSRVLTLLDLELDDSIVNVGGCDFPVEDVFQYAGLVADRPVRPMPRWLSRSITQFVPSTQWLLHRQARVDCRRLSELTGPPLARTAEDLWLASEPEVTSPSSLEHLKAIQRSKLEFRAYGLGYSRALGHRRSEALLQVFMDNYCGIVAVGRDFVTVKAGTTLKDLSEELDKQNLTLATLPEFMEISASACFFVQVHGSSNEHFSLFELIRSVTYLDDVGNVQKATRDDAGWLDLTRKQNRFILLELTFDCIPSGYLTNELTWHDDDALVSYLRERHRENDSTTVQWFPNQRRLLIYNINRATEAPAASRPSKPIYRWLPYDFARGMVRLRTRDKLIYDRPHNVLGPWKDLPLRRHWLKLPLRDNKLFVFELCVQSADAETFVEAVRSGIASRSVRFGKDRSIGIRFGYQGHGDAKQGFVWFEIGCTDKAQVTQLIELAEDVCEHGVELHRGKYLPQPAPKPTVEASFAAAAE